MAEDLAQDGRPVKYPAQGTIYPDIIESGARKTGGKVSTIKSHHNLIPFPEGVHFDLIEPLDHFFSDEVRALGTALGLPDYIVHRQPSRGWFGHPHHRRRGRREAEHPEERRRHRPRGSWTPTTSACSPRRASATASTASGSTSPCCPTSSPLASWATSAPTPAR